MKKGRDLFDVAISTYDSAELCRLVGTFLLKKIIGTCDKSEIRLYKYSSLSIFRSETDGELEKIKKSCEDCLKNTNYK